MMINNAFIKKLIISLLTLLFIFIMVFHQTTSAQETPCPRQIKLAKIQMPPRQTWDWSRWITGEFAMGLSLQKYVVDEETGRETWDFSEPEDFNTTFNDGFVHEITPDFPYSDESGDPYVIIGTLDVNQTGYVEEDWEDWNPYDEGYELGKKYLAGGGDIVGDWTLTMELRDIDHDEKLASKELSWVGTIKDAIAKYNEEYAALYEWILRDFGRDFFDGQRIDKFIYNYEQMPISCEIVPEYEELEVGEETIVELIDIEDHNGRPAKTWQRLYIWVEKGEILGGTERDEFKVFEVEDGSISLNYRAPDECKTTIETIEVYNSCEIRKDIIGFENKKIASVQFDIVCDD